MLRSFVHRALALLPALIILSWPAVGHATWSTDPSVNNVVAEDHSVFAYYPGHTACTDGAGGIFVAWTHKDIAEVVLLQHVLADGTIAPGWPANGLALTTPSSGQIDIAIVPDGAGGALVAWEDDRNGNFDIFAQRVSAGGVRLWGNAVQVSTASNEEGQPVLAGDGAQGMFVAWTFEYSPTDDDIYAMHILSNGAADGAWVGGGQGVALTSFEETRPAILSDAQGGLWIAWDYFNGSVTDIKLTHMTGTGQQVQGWAYGGTDMTAVAGGDQTSSQLATDGAGGVFVVWNDTRFGNSDVYVNYAASDATVPLFGWGLPLVSEASDQMLSSVCPDGQGGLFAVWDDGRNTAFYSYVGHVRQDGSNYLGWPADGLLPLTIQTFRAKIAPDGTGGVFLTFEGSLVGSAEIGAMHLLGNGTTAPGWGPEGNPVSSALGSQGTPLIVADGTGGALITWWDTRSYAGNDHYAQRIDGFGALGDASPAITSVQDVEGDQGGAVRLEWNASYLDAQPTAGIESYWIWRQVPVAALQAAGSRAVWLASGDDATALARAGRRVFARSRGVRSAASGYAWEYLASQPAHSGAAYSYVAATAADSSGVSFAYTLFMVEAHGSASGTFWPSAPDSGYSVDNLAPAMPAPFAGSYADGVTTMTWGENGEPDFAHYRLYRGGTVDFTPDPGHLVAEPASPGFTDPAGAPYVYKLSAVDVHGNESPVATLVPSGTTDVGDSVPTILEFAIAAGNPSRSGAELRFALPHPGPVHVAIFDALGRRVRTLVDATYPAGRFTADWDGVSEAGAQAGNGIYFVRLEACGRSLHRKLVIRR